MNYEEYLETKKRLNQMQEDIRQYERQNLPHSLSEACRECPITYVSLVDPRVSSLDDCRFKYHKQYASEVWRAFTQLGRCLHHERPTYYLGTCHPGSSEPYVRSEARQKYTCGYPRTVREMTPEQIKVSGEMMDEMIVIWNEYFMRCNPTVLCRKPWDFSEVKVDTGAQDE